MKMGYTHIWVFPKIGVGPQNGGFIKQKPIKMDDLGVPLFSETSIYNQPFLFYKPQVLGISRLVRHQARPRPRELCQLECLGTRIFTTQIQLDLMKKIK